MLMQHLGLGRHAVSNCKSPFRTDAHPSWGIFERGGQWFFKDHGTSESGDELDFLAQILRVDRNTNFALLVQLHKAIAECQPPDAAPAVPEPDAPSAPPDRTGFERGTEEQLARLAALRGLQVVGLRWAGERGILVFGRWQGMGVFAVTDQGGKVLEIRRLDGQPFPAAGGLAERKSHAIKGTQKSWPVGILEAKDSPCIALVEGLPDLLTAHHQVWQEQTSGGHRFICCAPVGMLAASVAIAPEALPQFTGKQVVIYPHADEAGLEAAVRWQKQLSGVAAEVRVFDMPRINTATHGEVKDLNDLARRKDDSLLREFPALSQLMPRD
jgi:hypothetical protein